MIRFHFGPHDVARTRFAISPLLDLGYSVPVLHDPPPLHEPWAQRTWPNVQDLDLTLLTELVPKTGYVPDFIAPPPATARPDLHAELARVRRTPYEQARREVGHRFAGRRPPPVARPLLDRGTYQQTLDALVDTMTAYWERALAPVWPDVVALIEADIQARAARLAAGGALEAFAGLHTRVRFNAQDAVLELNNPYDADVELDGRGLLLLPCAFARTGPGALLDEPWQPAVIYVPAGVGDLWAPGGRGGETAAAAVADLMGAGRAKILAALRPPISTTRLATSLGLSPAATSAHLKVLQRAGLATSRRSGREVRYERTELGDAILSGGDVENRAAAPTSR